MTGAYLRVNRYGKYENKEIEYLTAEEITETFKDAPKEQLISWIAFLVETFQPIAYHLDAQDNQAYDLKDL